MNFVASAADWAMSTGPPNWLFALALLTHPARWTDIAMTQLQKRFGSD